MAKKIIATCTVSYPRMGTLASIEVDVSEAFTPGVKPNVAELTEAAQRIIGDKLKVKVENGRDVAKALGERTV